MRRVRAWAADALLSLARALVGERSEVELEEVDDDVEAGFAPVIGVNALRMLEEGETLARTKKPPAKEALKETLGGSLRSRLEAARRIP